MIDTPSTSRVDFDPDRLDARSPDLIAALLPHARRVARRYFRVRVEGLEHVGDGPLLLIGNHNNGLAGPEILCALVSLWDKRGPDAPLYALAHDFAMRQFTAFGSLIQRFGALRASEENGRRALQSGAQLLVYPGGDIEAYRHFRRRNEVVFGKRSGFVRLAQSTGAPIVPVVAYGAHRSALIFAEGEGIVRRLGLDRLARIQRFPLALSLPWGLTPGPWLPYLPLPWPVTLRFLPPVAVAKSEDPSVVRERIRQKMQDTLHDLGRMARRTSTGQGGKHGRAQ